MGLFRTRKQDTSTSSIPLPATFRVTENQQLGELAHPDETVTAISENAAIVTFARRHNLLINGEPSWGNPWYLLADESGKRDRQVQVKRT